MFIGRIQIGAASFALALNLASPVSRAQSPLPPQNAVIPSKPALEQSAAGFPLVVELNKPIKARKIQSKKAKGNDKVECTVTMDLISRGKIVIPRATKITGYVADSMVRTKERHESEVKLTFERMILKDGREIPIQATIQSIGAPMQNSSQAFNDVDATQQPDSRPSPGPNEWRRIQTSTFPGSRRAANADAGGVEQADAGGVHRAGPSLGPMSQGVIGMKGISLASVPEGSTFNSTISSTRGNLHLSGGTQLVLRVILRNPLRDASRNNSPNNDAPVAAGPPDN